jgi:hypothetical protein
VIARKIFRVVRNICAKRFCPSDRARWVGPAMTRASDRFQRHFADGTMITAENLQDRDTTTFTRSEFTPSFS